MSPVNAMLRPSARVFGAMGRPPRKADAQGFRLALFLALAMACVIAGTVFGGRFVALTSIVPLALAVLISAGRDRTLSVALLFVYLAMEGMYKYLTFFSTAIYAIRPVLMAAVIVSTWVALRMRGRRVVNPPLTALCLLFAAWACAEMLNPAMKGLASGAANMLLFYLGPLAFYWVAYNGVKSSRQVTLFCWVLVAVCTIVSAFTIVQYSMGYAWTEAHLPGYKDIPQLDWWGRDEHGKTVGAFRPASTTAQSGGAPYWSNLGLITALGLLFSPSVTLPRKGVLLACILVNSIGLLLGGVRLMVFAAVFETVVFLLLASRSQKDILRNLALFLVVGVLLFIGYRGAQSFSGGTISTRYAETAANPLAKFQQDRGANLVSFWQLVTTYPLGLGYSYSLGKQSRDGGGADRAQSARNSETQFGATAGDMGIPGVLLVIGVLLGLPLIGWRAFRRLENPHLKALAAALLSSLFGYYLTCFGSPALQGSIHFWFVAGMLAVLPSIEKYELRQAAKKAAAPVLPIPKRLPIGLR